MTFDLFLAEKTILTKLQNLWYLLSKKVNFDAQFRLQRIKKVKNQFWKQVFKLTENFFCKSRWLPPFFSVVLLANKAEKNPSGNSKPRWRRQRGSLWSKKNNVGHHRLFSRPQNGLNSSLEKKNFYFAWDLIHNDHRSHQLSRWPPTWVQL